MVKKKGNADDLPLQVACIGLGSKGSFIAKKVAEIGVPLVVYDLVEQRAREIVGKNVRCADTLADALANSTLVFTAFANTEEYEDAYMETDGILKSAQDGAFVIDVTPITPHLADELYQLGTINGLHMLDGWMASAITTIPGREPSIFLGGDESDLKLACALIRSFKLPVIACANPGTGKSMGISSLIMHVSSILGVVEALSFAENQGISRTDAARFLDALGLRSDLFDAYTKKIIDDDYDGAYSVARLLSELEVCFEAAEAKDLTFPGLENAYQLYRLLAIIGGYEKDVTALHLIYADEQTCAAHGLDWSRAKEMSAENLDHDHAEHDGHGEACGCDDASTHDGGAGFDDGDDLLGHSPFYAGGDADDADDDWDEDDETYDDESSEGIDYDDIIADGFDSIGNGSDSSAHEKGRQ